MNEQDTLLLSAYIDEQLDTEQLNNLESRLQQEPELKRHLEELLETDANLNFTFNSIVDDPLPDELQRLLDDDDSKAESTTADVVQLRPANKETDKVSKPAQSSWVPMSLAASITLALGIVIGLNQTSVEMENTMLSEALQPTPALAQILNSSPSGNVNQADGSSTYSVRAELSFVDNSGDFCRQYHIQQQQQAYRGVACMDNQQWQNVVLVPASVQAADSANYQAASAFADPIINQYLEQNMQGIALGKDEEQRQLDKISN